MPEIYFPNLGIKINELSRVCFSVFGVDIYWYAVLIITGIVIGYFFIEHTLKKQGDDIENYLSFIILELILSFMGARTYYVIFSWDSYKDNLLEIFNLRSGGLGIYGGVLTAIIVAIVYTRVKKMNLGKLVDLFVPYLALGQCIGRWGNFINREAFGGLSDGLFAMALRRDTIRAIPSSLSNSFVNYFGGEYLQVQPTFLYESICTFIIFLLLLFLYNRKHFDGQILLNYMILYSTARFFIEGLRTDQLLIGSIPISQIVAVLLFTIGIVLYIINFKKLKELKNEK